MTAPILLSSSSVDESTLTNQIPSSPTVEHSAANAASGKRKPSRRANTAERRATHNAVERQRRETLNGRFLDLAALLPTLSQLRRPSKSNIVNTSIAHIHASRRHRLLASRELRILKLEADALRRELNEWRDRAGIPRVEEPVRGEGFSMVLSGELELVVPGMVNGVGMDDDDDDLYPNGYAEDEAYPSPDGPELEMVKNPNYRQAVPNNNGSPPPVSSVSSSPPYPHRPSISVPPQQPVMGGPMIASPTAMSFDNPAMAGVYSTSDAHIPHPQHAPAHIMYHPPAGFPIHSQQMGAHTAMLDAEKVAQWTMMQHQHQLNADQIYLASLARRGRSASMSAGSRSSGSASPVQTYEIPQYDGGLDPSFDGQWSQGGGKQQAVFAMM